MTTNPNNGIMAPRNTSDSFTHLKQRFDKSRETKALTRFV